jgi:Leucine-rich repeat (LRR) protein
MIIRNLPEALIRFTNLKYLNLSGLREHLLSRREGPISFGNLKDLVYLDLSCCTGVHGVLDNLGSLTKLQHLNLSRCSCFDDCTDLHHSCMSEAIRNLTELHYLNLSSCSGARQHPKQAFFVFLECIGNLLNLEHLDLSDNKNLTITN